MSIKKEWENFTSDEKITLITRYINLATKEVLVTRAEGSNNPTAQQFFARHDKMEFITTAFLKISASLEPQRLDKKNSERSAKGLAEITLKSLIYNAVYATIRAKRRNDIKHDVAQSITVSDENGNESDYRCSNDR